MLNAVINCEQWNIKKVQHMKNCIVTYPGIAWLIIRVLISWSNLLDLYTTGYNSSQITIFQLDTPQELVWLPTELLHYSAVLHFLKTKGLQSLLYTEHIQEG
jgi:hypothetical protein